MLDEIINYVQSLQNQVEVIKKTGISTLFHLISNIVGEDACLHLIPILSSYVHCHSFIPFRVQVFNE